MSSCKQKQLETYRSRVLSHFQTLGFLRRFLVDRFALYADTVQNTCFYYPACMDSTSLSYESYGTHHDASLCEFFGCTDSQFDNFDKEYLASIKY